MFQKNKNRSYDFIALVFIMFVVGQLSAYGQAVILDNERLMKRLKKFDVPAFSSMQPLAILTSGKMEEDLKGYFFDVGKDHNRQIKYVYIGRVESCKRGICMVDSEGDKSPLAEYFDYFMLIDKNYAVLHVEVYNYKASHGYEITARGWLKQFRGYDGRFPLRVGKDIDGITGATVSVHAITMDLSEKVNSLRSIDSGIYPGISNQNKPFPQRIQ